MACSPKEETTAPDVTIETVANTIDETTADFLKKLTTQEALVDTKATDMEMPLNTGLTLVLTGGCALDGCS